MSTTEQIEHLKTHISKIEKSWLEHLETAAGLRDAIRLKEYELKELLEKSKKYTVRIECDIEQEVQADDRAEAAQKAINEFLTKKLYTVHVEEV